METPTEFSERLSKVVAAAVKDAGLSQRAVAEQAGIPIVTLSRRLTGRNPFTVVELAAVAAVLRLSVVELALRAERAKAPEAA